MISAVGNDPDKSTFLVAHQPSLWSIMSWSYKHQKLPDVVLPELPRGFHPSSGLNTMRPILWVTVSRARRKLVSFNELELWGP
jgi:hypothetical protein